MGHSCKKINALICRNQVLNFMYNAGTGGILIQSTILLLGKQQKAIVIAKKVYPFKVYKVHALTQTSQCEYNSEPQINLMSMKVVVLGEGRVGKTSLLVRYVRGEFSDKQAMTINASFFQKEIDNSKGKKTKLAIWDTAGQQIFNSIAPIYYKDADAAIIVYDITFKESFRKVQTWMEELLTSARKDLLIVVAANKSDMQSNRQVAEAEALAYCKEMKVRHFDTSAKSGAGINQVFLFIADSLPQKQSPVTRGRARLKAEQAEIQQKKRCSC